MSAPVPGNRPHCGPDVTARRNKSARAFSCSSSSQAPYPSFPPQRGENSLIPLLRLSPANPLRWASPGAPIVVLCGGANNGPNPALHLREEQGSAPPVSGPHSGPQAVTRGFPAFAGVSLHAGAPRPVPAPPAGAGGTPLPPAGWGGWCSADSR